MNEKMELRVDEMERDLASKDAEIETWKAMYETASYNWSVRGNDAIKSDAEIKRLREALENLLVGHYNLYKKVWGGQSNPEVDMVRKIAKQALKGGK